MPSHLPSLDPPAVHHVCIVALSQAEHADQCVGSAAHLPVAPGRDGGGGRRDGRGQVGQGQRASDQAVSVPGGERLRLGVHQHVQGADSGVLPQVHGGATDHAAQLRRLLVPGVVRPDPTGSTGGPSVRRAVLQQLLFAQAQRSPCHARGRVPPARGRGGAWGARAGRIGCGVRTVLTKAAIDPLSVFKTRLGSREDALRSEITWIADSARVGWGDGSEGGAQKCRRSSVLLRCSATREPCPALPSQRKRGTGDLGQSHHHRPPPRHPVPPSQSITPGDPSP